MDKQKNIDNAKAVFAKGNSVKELIFTNDGQAFYGIEPAKAHQKELTGKTDGLHKVKNAAYVETQAEIVEDTVEADAVADDASPAPKTKNKKKEE